jgi:hypothetical protein
MKNLPVLSVSAILLLSISLLSLNRCDFNEEALYKRLRDHADQVKIIDTHEHQRLPEEFGDYRFRFYHLIAASYLASDVCTAGANGYDFKLMDSLSLDELWDVYGRALDYTRNTSYYSQFVKGFQIQYGFKNLYFTKENIAELSGRIEENYKNYNQWFNEAFNKAGFEVMFLDQWWNSFNTEIDEKHFALVFNINSLISESSKKPYKGAELKSIYKIASEDGFDIRYLDEYLSYCDHLLKKNLENNVVCLKNSQAYSRTLYYEDVPYEEARVLYNRPSSMLTPAEAKKIEDFLFHWIIQKSIEYNLPVQIHTGYLAGNGNVLDNGQPIKLNNLFLKYREAKFDLFHGGFPWTGEFAALGKMFPNVYLDLVWLPQISRQEAVSALDVMLDCVPYNKFFWGGDCGLIEESTGSLEFAKDVVAEVLAKRVERGLLTEDVAINIIDRIFRENAIEVFQLEKRLGREF